MSDLPRWKRRALTLCERGLVDDALAALIVDLLDADPELAAAGEPSLRYAFFHIRAPPELRNFILWFEPTQTRQQEAINGEKPTN